MKNATMTLEKLFDELVPMEGKADTVAGEIVRAINFIVYRNWNDGDHIGVDYGNETCNPPARFLRESCGNHIANIIDDCWGDYSDEYDKTLDNLCNAIVDYLIAHPELKETTNHSDMWDWKCANDLLYGNDDDDYDF